MDNDTKCKFCGISFCSQSNTRRHIRKFHGENFAPKIYKTPQNYKFSCKQCGKNYNVKLKYQQHIKTHTTNSNEKMSSSMNTKKCPLCHLSSSKHDILKHFSVVHDISLKYEKLDFPLEDDFLDWKLKMETETSANFIKCDSVSSKNNKISYFICNRSGNYKPPTGALRKRHLKTQGTSKINAYCPAAIKLTKNCQNNRCTVDFSSTHIGHEMELQHSTLKNPERQVLAQKIASKVPFDEILNEVRDGMTDELERIHLLTRKDLHNIEQSFNLGSCAVRHSNGAVSVESWVAEMRKEKNCILFYKPQGVVLEEAPVLKADDFVLIIMTLAQKQYLLKYGSDVVCIDETHGMNNYDFELTTLLVIDDLREGFPCSFLITNRSDKEIFHLFFSKIKNETSTIVPRVFMTDLADTYYNAWVDVMGIPNKRLFCTWHVDRAWRMNLNKIKTKEKQIDVYKQLKVLLQERDVWAFEKMLHNFLHSEDPEISDFIKYFKNYYSHTKENWAYAYRLHAGLNTNKHLESLHRTMKYIYLQGEKVKRLDKAIDAIMKLVRDKLFDRLISKHKGKVTLKTKEIRQRHKNMKTLNQNLISKIGRGWEVTSKNLNEFYLVEELTKTCINCQLVCEECRICIHEYHCSCVDCAIKFNMCKHIHMVANFKKSQEINMSDSMEINDNKDELHMHVVEEDPERRTILEEVRKESCKKSIEQQKTEISRAFMKHLNSITSPSKLEIVKKIIAPLSPTLAAACSQ